MKTTYCFIMLLIFLAGCTSHKSETQSASDSTSTKPVTPAVRNNEAEGKAPLKKVSIPTFVIDKEGKTKVDSFSKMFSRLTQFLDPNLDPTSHPLGPYTTGASNCRYFYFSLADIQKVITDAGVDDQGHPKAAGVIVQIGYQNNSGNDPVNRYSDQFFGYLRPANFNNTSNQIILVPSYVLAPYYRYSNDDIIGCPHNCADEH